MNRKQRIIVSITGIFIVMLALVGLTYAYFLTRITGNENPKSISVTTANLRLLYEDDTNQVVTEERLMPSNTVYTKSFTVKNEGNANIDYGVYLINVINTFERKDDIKYTMECTTNGTLPCGAVASETTFPSGISELSTATIEPQKTHTYTFKFTYKDSGTDQSVDMNKKLEAKIQIFGESGDGTILPYEEGTLAYNIINRAKSSLNDITLVTDGSVETRVANQVSTSTYGKTNPTSYPQELTNATNNYIAYACDYSINASGQFSLVGTDDCPITTTSTKYTNSAEMISALKGKFAMWKTSTSITTTNQSSLYKISDKDADFEETKFKYVSVNKYVSTEKVIATTEDDYGTSYYYRGGVENNYVTYANMCWRIVRIAGDGSVKLVLEDQDEPCSTNMNGNWNIPVSNEDGASTSGNFGYTNNNDEQWFMNYLNKDGKAENYSNSMASAFKNFQTTKLSSYLSDLKEGEWCLADKAYASESADVTTATPLTEAEKLAKQNSYSSYYYDSYVRLMGNSTKQPTLKCNGTKMDKFGDKTTMYVGALTADEIVYAGADANWNSNYAYYLLNDYQRGKSLWWWALSPYDFYGTYDRAFFVSYNGYLDYNYVFGASALRPSVSLKSSTLINAGGEGTLAKPYEVASQAN